MNAPTGTCDICGASAEIGPDWAIKSFSCPRCGTYDYDGTMGWLAVTKPEHMVRLSGWVREQNAAGVAPARITPDVSRRVMAMPLPHLPERARRALAVIARKYPALDSPPTLFRVAEGDLELQGVSYSTDRDDVRRLLLILGSEQFIERLGVPPIDFRLTVKGMLAAEEMATTTSASAQGFVAMSFQKSLDEAWTNGFDPGIRAAGFRPFRSDREDFVGGITDKLIAEIRRSKFVIADYTDQSNGVYFEMGFALGLGLTVIPTCRSDEVEKLHFDIKHLNALTWQTPSELAQRLDARIRAVVGAGPDST